MVAALQRAEPRLVAPNTRQVPSASFTKAGPPESPLQALEVALPTRMSLPCTRLDLDVDRELGAGGVGGAAEPAVADQRRLLPGLRMSVSHPNRIGTIGTSVTGSASTQKPKSPRTPLLAEPKQRRTLTRRTTPAPDQVSPKVIARGPPPVTQWLAVVITSGWTRVLVQPRAPTAVGHWQAICRVPPTIGVWT